MLAAGLAVAGGWFVGGCGRGDSAAPPPPRVDEPRRPVGVAAPDPRPTPSAIEPTVRVRIDRLAPGDSISLAPADRWLRVRDASGRSGEVFGGEIRCELRQSGWRLRPAQGPVLRLPRGRLEFATVPGEAASIRIERPGTGVEWVPGTTTLVPRASATEGVDLVAAMAIEDYLPGVLARELFGHWSSACFQAQAIAARSFAVCEASHWRDRRHYDLTTGPDTQAWEAGAGSGPEAAAVLATRGMVLTWNGLVIPAYFSSCCGGLPAAASDAIGSNPANAIAPLAGRSDRDRCCEEAPTYRWRRNTSTPAISRGLASWARRSGRGEDVDLGALRAIEIAETNVHGRPTAHALRDRSGRRAVWSSETFRRGLAAAMPRGSKPIYSAAIEPQVDPASAIFAGRGHGHGVGLCQYGAEAMAKSGASAETILERYYPTSWIHPAWP